MALPFELAVGLRYTRAGRRGRRKDGFMSFISGISVASIALGVMALIIVLSVMNGFQKEVRDRMLSVLSHAEVYNLAGSVGNWQDTLGTLKVAESRIVAGAPFVSGQALLSAGAGVQGAMVRGIDPAAEPSVSRDSVGRAHGLGRQPQSRQFRHHSRARSRTTSFASVPATR